MMNLDLIPKSSIDLSDKCDICVQLKKSRKSFNSVSHTSTLLELIHNDICELNEVLTREGKGYFIIFIDDFSKFCHSYLFKYKDEAFSKFCLFKLEVESQSEK